MHRGKSGHLFLKHSFSQMLYSSQRMSTRQCIAHIEVYLVMILFHFNSQPISIYCKHKKRPKLSQLPISYPKSMEQPNPPPNCFQAVKMLFYCIAYSQGRTEGAEGAERASRPGQHFQRGRPLPTGRKKGKIKG